MSTRGLLVGAAAVTVFALAVVDGVPSQAYAADDASSTNQDFSKYVDAKGQISRPEDFRQHWVHMGTWFVPDTADAAGPGLHDVYASPGTVEAYNKTGEFPDGAVLVKQISAVKAEQLTTGNAHYAGDTGVWFVMVRDRENRFPDNPIWGEGWGWALFKADQPSVNVNENWKQGGLSNCYACHIPAKEKDWVYTEGYPTLSSAK